MPDFTILLFDGFETLDAFGPAEIIGQMPEEIYQLKYSSLRGGTVSSSQGVQVETCAWVQGSEKSVLLIPGGMGTRKLVEDSRFIDLVHSAAGHSAYVLTVCTGSALLAKSGWLDGRRATSNKRAFDWVRSVNERVRWVPKARWVVDGRYYTSSGVSAGMDMTLGFVADIHGLQTALEVADAMEYVWNRDPHADPFFR